MPFEDLELFGHVVGIRVAKADSGPTDLAPSIRQLQSEGAHSRRNLAAGLNCQYITTARGQIVASALDLPPLTMLPVEDGPSGHPYYVGFEWIGGHNYLGEWPADGKARRGAHVTSSDAFVRFEYKGQVQALLIEWKYTEK